MTQAKETRPTPYDAEIARLEELLSVPHGMPRWNYNILSSLRFRREGYLAHGAEAGCGSLTCACYQDGVEAGLEQAAEGKIGVRP